MIYNLDKSTVEAISDGHDLDATVACFSQLSQEQIQSVEAIAMDMSPSYVRVAKQCIPLAEEKIVHDRFHVIELCNEAMAQVRKQEHRRLLQEGNSILSKNKYLWLTGMENHSEAQSAKFVCSLKLETGKAWAFKELLRDLWMQPVAASAMRFFREWYRRVIHTKLEPMKKFARTLKGASRTS